MKTSIQVIAMFAGALVAAVPVQAGLLGHLAGIEGRVGSLNPLDGLIEVPASQFVTAGIEWPSGALPSWLFDFDITNHQIILTWNHNSDFTFSSNQPFNGFYFTAEGVFATGATVDPASAFRPSSVVLGNNVVVLNYAGSFVPAGGRSIINLTLSDGSTVPEPASWALLITGFGLTGAILRRRRAAMFA